MTESDQPQFNLLYEPWIPCERADGTRVLVGIEQALLEAHTFAAIHDESPLVTATLHRLLLAVLQRVFLPRSMEDWVALWESPCFDAERIRAYLKKWEERFDLFHPERPFLQVARLAQELAGDPEPTPLWRMAPETSQHSNATQLFEPLPGSLEMSPSEAAKALLAFLGYTPGGRIQNEKESWSAAPLRVGAVVIVRGKSLWQTLLLNLLWTRERRVDDLPPWERSVPAQRATRAACGPVDQLVWQSRRVQLIPEGGATGLRVKHVVTAAGEQFEGDSLDAMFGYRTGDATKEPFPVRIERDRAAWRDSAALFDFARGAGVFRRPLACEQISQLVRDGIVDRTARFHLELLGLAGNKASIRLWRADRLPLSPSLLFDGERISTLRRALGLAEGLGSRLERDALWRLAENVVSPGHREAHKNDVRALIDSFGVMPRFWAALGQAFPSWLDLLGTADDPESTLQTWKEALRREARSAVIDATRRVGVSARALKASAAAERALVRVLREVLGDEPEFTPPAEELERTPP